MKRGAPPRKVCTHFCLNLHVSGTNLFTVTHPDELGMSILLHISIHVTVICFCVKVQTCDTRVTTGVNGLT